MLYAPEKKEEEEYECNGDMDGKGTVSTSNWPGIGRGELKEYEQERELVREQHGEVEIHCEKSTS